MKPFIVEFSGTPEAGKTTSIRTIANMLRNDGYKFYKEGMCKKEEYDEYKNTFVERLKPDLLIGLIVSTQIAVKRRGGKGHLVNCEYINRYNEIFLEFFEKLFCDKELVQTDFMDVYTMNDTIYEIITKRM